MRAAGAGLAPSVRRRGEILPCDLEHFAQTSAQFPTQNTRRDPLGLSALQIAARLSLGLSPFAYRKSATVMRLNHEHLIVCFNSRGARLAPSPGRHPVYQIGAALARPCTIYFTIAPPRWKNRSFERLARLASRPHPRCPAPPPRRQSAISRAPQKPPGSPV